MTTTSSGAGKRYATGVAVALPASISRSRPPPRPFLQIEEHGEQTKSRTPGVELYRPARAELTRGPAPTPRRGPRWFPPRLVLASPVHRQVSTSPPGTPRPSPFHLAPTPECPNPPSATPPSAPP